MGFLFAAVHQPTVEWLAAHQVAPDVCPECPPLERVMSGGTADCLLAMVMYLLPVFVVYIVAGFQRDGLVAVFVFSIIRYSSALRMDVPRVTLNWMIYAIGMVVVFEASNVVYRRAYAESQADRDVLPDQFRNR